MRPDPDAPSLWVPGWLKALLPWETGQPMNELTQARARVGVGAGCGGEPGARAKKAIILSSALDAPTPPPVIRG